MSEFMDAFEGTVGKEETKKVNENTPEPKTPKKKSNDNVVYVGCDIGTMNLVCSRSDNNDVKIVRNVFLSVDKDEIDISTLSNINYVEDEDNVFILGESAFQLSNILGKKIKRPMKSGLISPDEVDAADVITLMLKDLIGETKNKDVYCSYSIPANSIDVSNNVTYHERVFGRILSSLGINHTPLNEVMAIIYSNAQKEDFSAISISVGAGMTNVCIAWKGIETVSFSVSRAGDWIDKSVSDSLSIVQNRVTTIKEKHLNLELGFSNEKNKKRKRVLEGLCYYYESLINYIIKNIIKEFNEKVDLEIDGEIPIIIGGGTASVPGFLSLFKDNLLKKELPFEVSEVRMAKDPLTCVSNGLLIKTISDVGK